MSRVTDQFREFVEDLPKKKWKCKFCNNVFAGSVTRIKAHLAGAGRYGIRCCMSVDAQTRSKALIALNDSRLVELSNTQGDVEKGPHQAVIACNKEAQRETSFPSTEMNLPNPSLPTEVMISEMPISSSPRALQNMIPWNAQQGEPNEEVPQGANSPPFTSLAEMEWINELIMEDFSFGPQPSQNTIPPNAEEGEPGIVVPQGAGSSAFLPSPETNLPISSRPAELITAETDFPFGPQPPQNTIPLNAEEGEPSIVVPQDARIEDAVMVSRPGNGGLVDENVSSLKRKWERQSNREVVNNYRHYSFRKLSTRHAMRCRKSLPLITTKLEGGQSEETIKKICDYLMEDEIVIIGIYGMGGVGKTAILKHVHNKVLENPFFNDVFWVTVPQEFSICELQDEIANAIRLDNLSKDRDTERRASILNRHLMKKKRAVLMLDGLWMHFDYEDVGIPFEKGRIKLVLTTRSLNLCDKMLCQKQVEIRPLCGQHDCWDLFLRKLCFGGDLPPEVKKIASSILDKCKGLPLGIIEIATHMRGVKRVHEWKDLLQKLENLMLELNVFKKLKLSYMNLGDLQVQQCFLHLILWFGEYSSEDESIKKVLIESFIDEGLLSGIATRQELHDKGNTILDKIKKACLGVDIDGGFLFVHPLIRDMALQIVTSTTHMVMANMGLKEIPKDEFWTDHLEKVFLQSNDIREIPYGISPNCPKLMRLSLNNNVSLEVIHESFFKHMKGLKVLDLSKTKITELLDTISYLESLETLLLRECEELHCIPCVRKLGSLKKLDLSGCAMLEEVPEGMEMLAKLTYLDLLGTKIKALPEGVLGKLMNLQYLVINYMMDEEVEVELTIVEGLYCSVLNVETFNACVRLVEQNSSQPYDLALSASGNYFFRDKHERRIIIESCHGIAATVDGEIGGEGRALLPKNVQVLEVGRCSGVTSLCEVGPLNNLEELEIKEWEKLEELGAVQFPRLQRLNITQCTKLKHFLKKGHELQCLQWFKIEGSEVLEGINIAAPFLYNIEVYRCPKMKWVVKWQWLATRLPNLRSIKIKNCRQLEEIVGGLPPIGATCRLTKIEIEGCNNLKRFLMMRDMMDEKVRVELTIVVPNVETFNACVRLVEQNSSQPYDLALIASGNCFSRNKHERRRIIIESCHSIAATVDGEIGGDGRALLPKNVQVLEVGRCSGVTSLCEVGPLNNLEELEIEAWEKLEELGAVHFPRLRRLNITQCTKLKHFLKEGHELRCLQRFKIEGSEELEGINIVAPFLCNIKVYKCPKMKWVVNWQWLATRFPNLRSIEIKDCEQLEEIVGGLPPIGATCRLTKIEVEGCNNLKRVLMVHDMLLNLPFLQNVKVESCMGVEAIIGTVPNMMQPSFLNLISLTLWDLPELKSICEGTVSCLSFQHMMIEHCPKLKRLPLLDNGPLYCDDIWIDELTWQSLEWDQSPFQPSLLHFARCHGVSNWHDQRTCVCIASCDAITARVDGQIGRDGCNLLPRNVQVLEVGGGSGVTSLSQVGPLENLEELTINEWKKLEELGAVHFPQLQGLNIKCCSKLKRLSVEGQGLPHLRQFTIIGSEELEGIDLAAPNLNFVEVRCCHKMKRVMEWDWLTTRLSNLKSIGIFYCEKLEEIIGGPLPIDATCLLTQIKIEGCNMEGVLLTQDMLLHIPFLKDIRVVNCEGIEAMIGTAPNMTQPSFSKLTHLTLINLSKLKLICDRMESCDHIEYIEIYGCMELKRIPLRLHPLDNGLLSPPPSLGQIWTDEETWQALEWDHPLARVSLEPFIEFIG